MKYWTIECKHCGAIVATEQCSAGGRIVEFHLTEKVKCPNCGYEDFYSPEEFGTD